jgi:hypothetical protein
MRRWPVIFGILVIFCTSCSGGGQSNSKVPTSAYVGGKPPNANVVLPRLPAAAPLPPGSADQQALALSADVEGGGDNVLPALLAALSASGIAVRAADGSVRPPVTAPGQGFTVDQAQLEVIDMLAQNETSLTVSGLAAAIVSAIPALKDAQLDTSILDGLRTNAQAKQPEQRFFARFVVGLVRNSRYAPTDIMTVNDPAAVSLDGVAMELIILRLAADFNALQVRTSSASLNFDGRSEQVQLLVSDKPLCHLDDATSQVMDAGANAQTIGFEKLLQYLESHHVTTFEKLGNAAGVVNTLAAVAKLLAYVAATEVTIDMQPPPPLVRTKMARVPGAKAILEATQVLNNNKYLELINCFRIMLNAVGMDFSVGNSGAVEGAQVAWECWVGCGSSSYSNAGGATGPAPIVEFTRTNPDDPATGDTQHQRTDKNGKSSIGIEGVPQPLTLPDNANPVKKEAEVVARFQMKPPSISQDLIDASGGFSVGIGSVVTAIVETLLRTNLLKIKSYTFEVTDWMVKYKVDIQVHIACNGLSGFLSAIGTITQDPATPGSLNGAADYMVTGIASGGTNLQGTLTESDLTVWLGSIPGFPENTTLGGVGTFKVPATGGTVTNKIQCGQMTATVTMIK